MPAPPAPPGPTPISPATAEGAAAGTLPVAPRRSIPGPRGLKGGATASIDQEVRALRSVERALRDGQPGLALALLSALDREVPQGKLGEEREALSVIARCAQGQAPLGVDLGELFAERYPGSVYARRTEQACAAAALSSPDKRITAHPETEGK